ncbi:MAG: hypothetical protein JRI68_29410 [Deltaproteobacteria bacterium]|nr:hypothetical protein [Deltaproteobacteria bacterium]
MSGTSPTSQRYMRAFVHLPLLQMAQPKRALVICFGVGNTLHAASLHPSMERLEVADLSRHVLHHASFFEAANGQVLVDPRVAVFVNDGRHHLLMQPADSYDLVTLEPPPITFAGVAALYSREFYELVRSRLTPTGYPLRASPWTLRRSLLGWRRRPRCRQTSKGWRWGAWSSWLVPSWPRRPPCRPPPGT